MREPEAPNLPALRPQIPFEPPLLSNQLGEFPRSPSIETRYCLRPRLGRPASALFFQRAPQVVNTEHSCHDRPKSKLSFPRLHPEPEVLSMLRRPMLLSNRCKTARSRSHPPTPCGA